MEILILIKTQLLTSILQFIGIAPFVHFCRYSYFPDPISSQKVFKALILLAMMALIYIFGALIYILKIPDRLYPKTFDIWFNSHQLFHIMTITGGILFFHSMSLMADTRLNYPSNVEHNSTIV